MNEHDEFDTPAGARLTSLMERAVAEPLLTSEDATAEPLPRHRTDSGPRKARWAAIMSVAAAVLLAVGVLALDGDRRGDQTVRTADSTPDPGLASIYRVPTKVPDGLQSHAAVLHEDPADLIAVDDIGDPRRWIVVTLNGSPDMAITNGSVPQPTTVALPGSKRMFVRHLDGDASEGGPANGDLTQVAITGSARSFPALTILASGVDDAWLESAGRAAAAAIPTVGGDLALPTSELDPVVDALAALELPNGMTPVRPWDAAMSPAATLTFERTSRVTQGSLHVEGGIDGCSIWMRPVLPPAVSTLVEEIRRRLTEPLVERQLVDPKLGLAAGAAWLVSTPVDGRPALSNTADLSFDDGSAAVIIGCWVPPGAGAQVEARGRAVTLASGLRAVASENEFRSELAARGVTVEGG
jgi:hypothetical protein